MPRGGRAGSLDEESSQYHRSHVLRTVAEGRKTRKSQKRRVGDGNVVIILRSFFSFS